MYNLSSLLPIQDKFIVLVGNSGSGKSSFCKILCDYIKPTKKIYYYNPHNSTEFVLNSNTIIALKELKFSSKWIETYIDPESVIIFDDFCLEKSEVTEFRNLINYFCRHRKITFIIIIHSLFKNNIYNEVNLSSHLFLLKSESSRQIASRKKVLNAYNTLNSTKLIKQVLYLNLVDEYSLSLSSDILLHKIAPIKMFTQKDIFTIHVKNSPCPDIQSTNDIDESNEEDIFTQYSPRNRKKIFFILSCFKKNEIFKDNLVTVGKSHFMHIFDVLTLFLNPFSKKELSKQEISFLKKLKICTKLYPLPNHTIPIHLKKYL
mgnify:FL=1